MVMTEEERDALIERYLGNKLGAAERAAFEIRLLEDPELLEQVQLAEAFRSALLQQKSVLVSTNAGNNILPFRAWLRQPLSLAASVLVAAFGMQMVFSGSGEAPVPAGMAVGSMLLLEATRGATTPTFTGQPPYLFQIDAGFGNDAAEFEVRLLDVTDGSSIFEQAGLRADTEGWVRLLYTASLTGQYEVELRWVDGQGQSQTRAYPVSVSAAGE